MFVAIGDCMMAQEVRHIDMGLSVDWGDCNIGAVNPYEHGLYFAWGETVPYGDVDSTNINSYNYENTFYRGIYSYETYKWFLKQDSTAPANVYYPVFSKYCIGENQITAQKNKSNDGLITLEGMDDAANVIFGDRWRMPTKAEMQELIDKCTWIWTDNEGVCGYRVVSKINGNAIFLPLTGLRFVDKIEGEALGYYWSSSLSTSDLTAEALMIDVTGYQIVGRGRFIGNAIRPVWDNK